MPDELLNAVTSDPVAMGWMEGTPPAPDKRLLAARADHMRFPTTRWAFSHMREFTPTARVAGAGGAALLRTIDGDLGGVRFTPLGREGTISVDEALLEAFTDGILVLHRGTVVFERWFGVTGPETRHIAFSMTKSFVGTLAEMLVEEGRLDPSAPVLDYVPELAGSGFADATLRQVMDMTTAIDFSEDYADPSSGIGALSAALALTPRPAGYAGPSCLPDFLPTIGKAGEHGEAFVYRTANTDVLAWVIARIEGRRLHETLSERLWRPLGLAGDADMLLDPVGTPFAGGGLNLRLEDLARFGEVIRTGGAGVIPPAVIARIREGGDPAKFDLAGRYPELPGWSYRSQWWISHDEHGCFSARGIHGQSLWIDPAAEMVIARFASHPVAANSANAAVSLPAWRALALALNP